MLSSISTMILITMIVCGILGYLAIRLLIERPLLKLMAEARLLAQGDLSQPIGPAPGILLPLGEGLSSIRSELREIALESQSSGGQIAAATEQVSVAMDRVQVSAETIAAEAFTMNQIAEEMAGMAQQASAQVQEVAAATQSISQIAGNIHEESKQATRQAEEGSRSVRDVQTSMDQIESNSHKLAQHITELKQSTEKVDSILGTIGSIANQTKLLALNAAIEAARAGEAGKGFAVVAGEVTKLSEASALAVQETEEILNQIQRGVDLSVEALNEELAAVSRGVLGMDQAEASLRSIVESIAQVSQMVAKASTARNFQIQAAERAAEMIETMAAASTNTLHYVQRVSQGVDSQKESIREVADLTEGLLAAADGITRSTASLKLVSETMLQTPEIQGRIASLQRILRELSRNEAIGVMTSTNHREINGDIRSRFPYLEAFYTSGTDGAFVFSDPSAALANAKIRPWWQAAMAGHLYVSEVYISAITKRPCLTLSYPIYGDGENIVGVLGVDMRIGD